MNYAMQMHEDHGGDRSIIGKYLGIIGGGSIAELSAELERRGAPDIAGFVRSNEHYFPQWLEAHETFYCGAATVDGTYTRFDIQEAS